MIKPRIKSMTRTVERVTKTLDQNDRPQSHQKQPTLRLLLTPAPATPDQSRDRQDPLPPSPETFASAAACLSRETPPDEVSLRAVLSFFQSPTKQAQQLICQSWNCLAWLDAKEIRYPVTEPTNFPKAVLAEARNRHQQALQYLLKNPGGEPCFTSDETDVLQTTADLCQVLSFLASLGLPDSYQVLKARDIGTDPTGIGRLLWQMTVEYHQTGSSPSADPAVHQRFWQGCQKTAESDQDPQLSGRLI